LLVEQCLGEHEGQVIEAAVKAQRPDPNADLGSRVPPLQLAIGGQRDTDPPGGAELRFTGLETPTPQACPELAERFNLFRRKGEHRDGALFSSEGEDVNRCAGAGKASCPEEKGQGHVTIIETIVFFTLIRRG
jgi:hypothetical protein